MRTMKIAALAVLAGLVLPLAGVSAQPFPSRPVTFVVGYPAGGGTDSAARFVAKNMEKVLGQSVIVENRPGGNTLVAANHVARSAPDGYTLMFGPANNVGPVFNKVPLDIEAALTPVSNVISGGMTVLVREGFPAKDWKGLVAYSKANPDKLNFGSSSPQSEMFMKLLKERTGVTFTAVGYPGDAPIITALLGNQVDFGFINIVVAAPHVKEGKLKPVMVTKTTKSALLPDVPTPAELGIKEFAYEFNLGLWAPRGTPKEIVERLNKAVVAVVRDSALKEQITKTAGDPVGSTPAEQLSTLRNDLKVLAEAAKIANFQPQ